MAPFSMVLSRSSSFSNSFTAPKLNTLRHFGKALVLFVKFSNIQTAMDMDAINAIAARTPALDCTPNDGIAAADAFALEMFRQAA